MTTPAVRARSTRRPGPTGLVWRLPILVVVVLVLVVIGLAAGSGSTATAPSAPVLASRAAPVDAVSSDWYCTGGSGGAGLAPAVLSVDNVAPITATGTVIVVNDKGQHASAAISVPARGQTTVVPDQLEAGDWLAADVEMNAGGVMVTEFVHGSDGWAEAPCATNTSSQWSFAAGSTASGDSLFVSLFNPTTTTSVVDLSFATGSGELQPPPFQGLVLPPKSVVVAEVASFVQNQPSVATVVQTRSGQVVAAELMQHAGAGITGLSLRLGAPAPEASWYLPRSADVSQGSTFVVVFNPTPVPETAEVAVRLASGPIAPFVDSLAAFSVWTLNTSQEARIPTGSDFSVTVTSSGGPGVVVERVTSAPSSASHPQWGLVSAVPASSTQAAPSQWLLPSPAGPVFGAVYGAVALENATAGDEAVRVEALTPTGPTVVANLSSGHLGPRAFLVINQAALTPFGTSPLLVQSTGPLAAVQEAAPSGVVGAVATSGIPLG